MNPTLLNILYKYDAFSAQFQSDWTDAGNMECKSYKLEFISDTIVKINIIQQFTRCFSYYKESNTISSDTGKTTSNSTNWLSLYPNLFLDYENNDLSTILTSTERANLLDSKLLNVTFNTIGGRWIPTVNTIASRSVVYPDYIESFTFIDTHIHYPRTAYTLTNSVTAEKHTISGWADANPGEDGYSSYAKTFNVINDSTVELEFELYLNSNKFKYLLDLNDVNINYHINALGDATIGLGTFTLDIYETLTTYFKINDIIYIKDIYSDTISSVCKIINIVNNKLTLSSLWSINTSAYDATNMDRYVVNKLKNLENFNNVQVNNNILRKLANNNLLVFDTMEFTSEDYLALNNIG